jgi:hypothetical protein
LNRSVESRRERAIYLTNYARPFNMARQIEVARTVRPAVDIILIDNSAPQSNLPPLDLEGIELVQTGCNRGAGFRFELAANRGYRAVLCIDDDIFPTSEQIERLFERQAHEPDRVHGIWGEDVGQLPFGRGFKTHVCGRNCEVDILNRLYLLTPDQARNAMSLAARLGFAAWSEIGPCEDMLLSFASPRRPACHDVGPIEDCPSSNEAGIACWREDGFFAYRLGIVKRIRRLNGAFKGPRSLPFRASVLWAACLLLGS